MGRARRTGDSVVALDAVIRLLAHITKRAYSQLVAAVRLLAPSGRWYVDTSLRFVHDRRDVPDYLARVLYASLVVRDLVRDGGVTLVDLFTDDKYAGHRDALAMSVTFNGKGVAQVEYDRYTQGRDDAGVVVVPRGSGQHFALTGATTYGDVWLRARGYELTKGRVTSDRTYMSMLLGEVHDIYPLPTHETHYVLVMREREGGRGYEYTVPVRVGRLHDMQSDGVIGIIIASSSSTTATDPSEHGRTHVIPAPGAFAIQKGKEQVTQRAVVALLVMQQQTHRLWMLIDVVLIWKRFFSLRKKWGGSDHDTYGVQGPIKELRDAQRPLHEAARLLAGHIAATVNAALSVGKDAGTGTVSPVSAFSRTPGPWTVLVIIGEVNEMLRQADVESIQDGVSGSDEDARKSAESLTGTMGGVYALLLAIETKVASPSDDGPGPENTEFGQPAKTFALCDGVPCFVDTTSEAKALTALDRGMTSRRGVSHCVYFAGEMHPPYWSVQQQQLLLPSVGSDDDVSVLSARVRDMTAVCVVIKVKDAMDLVEKTRMYVSGIDRPLMRLSTGAGVESPLVTYLCAYTVSNLNAWYRRYRDSRYQSTRVLSTMPAALVVVDKDLAAALDHMQAAKFSCGPRVVRALVDDLCRGTLSRQRVLLCVALAYQRSEFSMAPYVEMESKVDVANAAHESYASRVAYAGALASTLQETDSTDDDLTAEPHWEQWLDVDGDTDDKRKRQRDLRKKLIDFVPKSQKKEKWGDLLKSVADAMVRSVSEASEGQAR